MLVPTTIQNSVISHKSCTLVMEAFSEHFQNFLFMLSENVEIKLYSLLWKQQLGGWKSPLVAVLELTASDLPELMRFQPAVTEFLQSFYVFHFSEHFVLVIFLGAYFGAKCKFRLTAH